MYEYIYFKKPVKTGDYPHITKGSSYLRSLRRCGCGRMSFLDEPCAFCGKNLSTYKQARIWNNEVSFWAISAGGVILSVLLLWRLFGAIIGVIALAASLAAYLWQVYKLSTFPPDERREYWYFHSDILRLFSGKEQNNQAFEMSNIEDLIDSWFFDIARLEQMEEDKQFEKALIYSRRLGAYLRSPRLSRLQYRLMLQIKENRDNYYMIDEFSSNLKACDVPDNDMQELINLIGDAALSGRAFGRDTKVLFKGLVTRHLEKLHDMIRQRHINYGASIFKKEADPIERLLYSQKRFCASVFNFWRVDEKDIPYTDSGDPIIRELMATLQ